MNFVFTVIGNMSSSGKTSGSIGSSNSVKSSSGNSSSITHGFECSENSCTTCDWVLSKKRVDYYYSCGLVETKPANRGND